MRILFIVMMLLLTSKVFGETWYTTDPDFAKRLNIAILTQELNSEVTKFTNRLIEYSDNYNTRYLPMINMNEYYRIMQTDGSILSPHLTSFGSLSAEFEYTKAYLKGKLKQPLFDCLVNKCGVFVLEQLDKSETLAIEKSLSFLNKLLQELTRFEMNYPIDPTVENPKNILEHPNFNKQDWVKNWQLGTDKFYEYFNKTFPDYSDVFKLAFDIKTTPVCTKIGDKRELELRWRLEPNIQNVQEIQELINNATRTYWSSGNFTIKNSFEEKEGVVSIGLYMLDISISYAIPGKSKIFIEKPLLVDITQESSLVLAHELGHILGFPDCYFEFYDKNNTQDIIYYTLDPRNLMCSLGGKILERYRKLLIDKYCK